jgi:hypothetical protein
VPDDYRYDRKNELLVPDNDREDDPNEPLTGVPGQPDLRAVRETWTLADLPSKDAHFEDAAADMSENELQAGTGQVCPVCHRAIADGEPVRRRIDGTYQHDAC